MDTNNGTNNHVKAANMANNGTAVKAANMSRDVNSLKRGQLNDNEKEIMGYKERIGPECRYMALRSNCLIIYNTDFKGKLSFLKEYENDFEKIEKNMQRLNFEITVHNNLTKDKMIDAVKEFCEKKDHSPSFCSLCFILSHGGAHGVLYGTDGEKLPLHVILQLFEACKTLKNKPKLFYFQACRGEENPLRRDVAKAAGGESYFKYFNFRDVSIHHSTTEGFRSYLQDGDCSYFIRHLYKVLKQASRKCDLWDMAAAVNRYVASELICYKDASGSTDDVVQTPELQTSLPYKLYFKKEDNEPPEKMTLLKKYICGHEKNRCHVLINPECKHYHKERYEEDFNTIKKTFEGLQFSVVEHRNIAELDMKKQFDQFAKERYFENSDCFMYFILGCGGLSESDNVVFTQYGKYSFNDMLERINRNKALRNKPKFFFILFNDCNQTMHRTGTDSNQERGVFSISSKVEDAFVYYCVIEKVRFEARHDKIIPEFWRVATTKDVDINEGDFTDEYQQKLKAALRDEAGEPRTVNLKEGSAALGIDNRITVSDESITGKPQLVMTGKVTSNFMQILCEVFASYAKHADYDFHLGEVVVRVNELLIKEREFAQACSTLKDNIFFTCDEKKAKDANALRDKVLEEIKQQQQSNKCNGSPPNWEANKLLNQLKKYRENMKQKKKDELEKIKSELDNTSSTIADQIKAFDD